MLSARLTFNLRCLASQFINTNAFTLSNCRCVSTKETTTPKEGAVYPFQDEDYEEELKAREEEIERKRNKSELYPEDYNRQHDKVPFEKPMFDFQESLRYKRRLYGKYGAASNVDPSILWPDKKELAAMREYEEAAQPFTLQQLIQRNREKNAQAEEKLRKAEAEILEKVGRVNEEIIAFHKRVAAQKEKALAMLERKNKLIEKVKKHFGYNLDPRDEKFKEVLEKLQKEEKKQAKADKKAEREKKLKMAEELAQEDKADKKLQKVQTSEELEEK